MDPASPSSFTALPDLASRALGGGVVHTNDELFAEAANLLTPGDAAFDVGTFGHKGKIYDGWETRRRRTPGSDHVIIRLGAAGVLRGLVIDTMWFKGNFPTEASVEAVGCEGYPSPAELAEMQWDTVLPRSPLKGHFANTFAVTAPHRYTHVRLTIYPDGGVARFRVFGDAVPDPRLLPRSFDLLALENGGRALRCSNDFYSSPANLLLPGRARSMGEGWENARRRGAGNDWVELQLGVPGLVTLAEVDTSYFVGNSPGEISLRGRDERRGPDSPWVDLLARQAVQPDTVHRLPIAGAEEITHVRLDVFPDGGLSRLRLWGELTDAGREEMARRWYDSLPRAHAEQVPKGHAPTTA